MLDEGLAQAEGHGGALQGRGLAVSFLRLSARVREPCTGAVAPLPQHKRAHLDCAAASHGQLQARSPPAPPPAPPLGCAALSLMPHPPSPAAPAQLAHTAPAIQRQRPCSGGKQRKSESDAPQHTQARPVHVHTQPAREETGLPAAADSGAGAEGSLPPRPDTQQRAQFAAVTSSGLHGWGSPGSRRPSGTCHPSQHAHTHHHSLDKAPPPSS